MTKTAKVQVEHTLKVTHPKGSTEATCSCGHWAMSIPLYMGTETTNNTIVDNHALHKSLSK